MPLNSDSSHPSSHYPRVSRQSYSALLAVITAVACPTTKKSVAAGANTIYKCTMRRVQIVPSLITLDNEKHISSRHREYATKKIPICKDGVRVGLLKTILSANTKVKETTLF
ncbi:hypothetical protein JG688_00013143 [Phytophthora aleatoria]|uniref:Uncharacterized protein n=1 Tax=Phytophthora aleatoria TaxID=2496075 RepID=A0A8J5IMR2_9STRA|nr:hypothetical protein JG688_00013143 [Phytophthora aleatoria]